MKLIKDPKSVAVLATQPVRARPLTRRQLLFIEFYSKHSNASRAAREAGYSAKTAYSIGWENLQKPAIKAALPPQLPDNSLLSQSDQEDSHL